MTGFLEAISARALGPMMFMVLIGGGLFLLGRTRFFFLLHPIRCTKELLAPPPAGGVSPFRAVTMALASTLGVGNIVGVASAIAIGGPGAMAWMWISALVAMVVKYAEIVLAVHFRRQDRDGYVGGAMYYMKEGLGGKFGAGVAAFFAVLLLANAILTGNIVQSHAVASALDGLLSPLTVGIVLSVLVFLVIFGGLRRISEITVKLVPFLCAVYIVISLYIIMKNFAAIPSIFARIFESAFRLEAGAGGVLGFLMSRALRLGTTRGILSNEAGCGTAPTAHASANTRSPFAQGLWGIFEVFTDTILLCSMTALVILISYDDLVAVRGLDGIALTMASYGRFGGTAAEVTLAVSIALFAYATIICQSYYGTVALRFLGGGKRAELVYHLLYGTASMLGAMLSLRSIFAISDVIIALMTIVNTAVVVALSRTVREETKRGLR